MRGEDVSFYDTWAWTHGRPPLRGEGLRSNDSTTLVTVEHSHHRDNSPRLSHLELSANLVLSAQACVVQELCVVAMPVRMLAGLRSELLEPEGQARPLLLPRGLLRFWLLKNLSAVRCPQTPRNARFSKGLVHRIKRIQLAGIEEQSCQQEGQG